MSQMDREEYEERTRPKPTSGSSPMSKSSGDPITRRAHRLAQAMGRRAHVRVAWTMQAPGQGLGKSQPPRPRIPTSRVDQAHAEKAMQSNMIFPDRL
jgi:hypothetical protein